MPRSSKPTTGPNSGPPVASPGTAIAPDTGSVRVRGAREHNLKDVDLDVPRDRLVVFSGVSGSGKSSLAFGTLYAEAQRRYFESVAPYARRLIDQAGVPDVDSIEGLPPAIALQQQRGASNARSSVGSVTTLSSLVPMMYSRAGVYPPKQAMLYAEDFSPNTPQGACPTCHGLGHVYEVTEALMVPDPSLTIREKAIASWPPAWHGQNLRDILVTLGYDVDTPWKDLPKKDRDWILFTEETPTVPVYAGFTPAETRAALKRKAEPSYMGTYSGARRYVLHTFASTQSALMKKRVSRYLEGRLCPQCDGKRLKREALSVTFAGVDIGELSRLPLDRVVELLEPVACGEFHGHASGDATNATATKADRAKRAAAGQATHAAAPDVRRTPALSEEKRLAAQRLAEGVIERLHTLQALGLGYLSLDRATPTLSPGELQRLRLATQLRSHLFGVVYVLDEPSAGLHPADSQALYDALEQLRDAGNSVFVVEHGLELMRRAQWLVDVGPDAGERGGRVLYSGPPAGLADVPDSRTTTSGVRVAFRPDAHQGVSRGHPVWTNRPGGSAAAPASHSTRRADRASLRAHRNQETRMSGTVAGLVTPHLLRVVDLANEAEKGMNVDWSLRGTVAMTMTQLRQQWNAPALAAAYVEGLETLAGNAAPTREVYIRVLKAAAAAARGPGRG